MPSASARFGSSIPPADCQQCPRLALFRAGNRVAEPTWHNDPVPAFGAPSSRLLIVGLAPGLRGANRTGRPFTGDYAGDLLYATLLDFGFASGSYGAEMSDSLKLCDCRITNAVRCVPPENKPTTTEIATCRPFLSAEIAAMPALTAIVVLGRIAHDSTLASLGAKRSSYPFKHAAAHRVAANVTMYDSFHCSRYNTNTGRLTTDMFRQVFAAVRRDLDHGAAHPKSAG